MKDLDLNQLDGILVKYKTLKFSYQIKISLATSKLIELNKEYAELRPNVVEYN